MGRGKKSSVLASLFGFKKQSGGAAGKPEEEAAARQQEPRYYQGARVRPSDDDGDYYYGRHWYADRDIDQRASEFIERVHRGMLANDQDAG
ncbi:unnamed protein product [Urochloa decumbens]|uniref:Uncharacterized protein n=1 Tax=Urochloa decumbens TaxID=240449 RepID=A0ABC8ZQD8_9POAL